MKKPWDVTVDVILHSDAPVDFDIDSYLVNRQTKRLTFYNSHRPGFTVTFNLIDETGKGYRFPDAPNEQDAIWSIYTDDPDLCPDEPVWQVFPNDDPDPKHQISVKDKGKTMSAFNPNPSPAKGHFRYTLNVSKDGKEPYLALDPGGNNQNGNY